MRKRYRWLRGLRKGVLAAAAIGAGLVAGAEMLGSLSAVQELTAITAIGAVTGAIRVGMNWWKVNRDLADTRYTR